MSRRHKSATNGNLSSSMRANYEEYGVKDYYRKVGSTYRNPHFPGVRLCIFAWLNKWWQMENRINSIPRDVLLFDMAAGSGEATLAFSEWWRAGRQRYVVLQKPNEEPIEQPLRENALCVPPLGPAVLEAKILAADPFTAAAYRDRTSLPCASMSFRDIAEGGLPLDTSVLTSPPTCQATRFGDIPVIDMVICSFALHLVETPSELFALLWELSTKATWLVLLAPHKKPEIKEGWGWKKWDVDAWDGSRMGETKGDFLFDRVHCRVYRSLNICD